MQNKIIQIAMTTETLKTRVTSNKQKLEKLLAEQKKTYALIIEQLNLETNPKKRESMVKHIFGKDAESAVNFLVYQVKNKK